MGFKGDKSAMGTIKRPSQGRPQGQYHLNKENIGEGLMFERDAMICWTFASALALTAFEHARVEAQATGRQQGAGLAQFGQHVLPEAGTGLGLDQGPEH